MDLYTIWMVLAIGLASNLDNAGVGIAYGVRKIRISRVANSIIACASMIATFIGGALGNVVSLWVSVFIAHLIGTVVMVSVGIWVLCQPLIEKQTAKRASNKHLMTQILRSPVDADRDHSKSINSKEAVLLGTALSMNALAGGFDAGIIGIPLIATAMAVGLFSYLLMAVCSYVGSKFAANIIGEHATILSGLLLIIIGLQQIF